MFQSWTRDQHSHQFATQENRFIVLLRRWLSVHQESTTPCKLPGKISQSSHYTAWDVAQRRQPCIVERKWGRKQLWRCPVLLQFHIRRQCVRGGRLFQIEGMVESDYCGQQSRVRIWLEVGGDLLACTFSSSDAWRLMFNYRMLMHETGCIWLHMIETARIPNRLYYTFCAIDTSCHMCSGYR